MGPVLLHLDLHPGHVAQYVVRMKQTEIGGSNENRPETATPIRVTVLSAQPPQVEVLAGPLQVSGRSVGRAKKSRIDITPQGAYARDGSRRPASLFGVALPTGPLAVGAKWTSGVNCISPLPAGLTAVCRLKSYSPSKGAEVEWRTQRAGATKIDGSGTLWIGTDGIVDRGKLNISIAYLRSDHPGAPLKISSTVKLAVVIQPR